MSSLAPELQYNIIYNIWMEKLTFKRWKVNLHLDTYTQTPQIVAYWAAPFAAKKPKNPIIWTGADTIIIWAIDHVDSENKDMR